MMSVFNGKEFKKIEFDFPNDSRFKIHKLKLGSEQKIVVKDKEGNEKEIEFYVVRDARLGKDNGGSMEK